MKKFTHVICLLSAFGTMQHLDAAEDISYEINANYSYVGGARTGLQNGSTGLVQEQSNLIRVVASPKTKIGLVRIGVDWQRYSFGLPPNPQLPNTLQATSLVIGLDTQYSDTILLRFEAQPGFYGNGYDISSRDLNVPFVLGGMYLRSAELQFVFGIGVDVNRHIPVIPGVGVNWKFAEKWVLEAILPRPRLKYLLNQSMTLYTGADLRGGTYRMDGNFGTANGNSQLNNAIVEYTEIRVSAGASWLIRPATALELETGYMAYREFDFNRADTNTSTKQGAAYGQLSFSCKF